VEDTKGESASSAGADALAVAVGLAGAGKPLADTYLQEQTRLVRLQASELAHELDLRHWSLRVREKFAPDRGRLHLKRGEALAYAGRRHEARAQLARAAVDPTPSEQPEHARAAHV
jgi:hypothetical protein